MWLFLLGVLVGVVGTYIGFGELARRSSEISAGFHRGEAESAGSVAPQRDMRGSGRAGHGRRFAPAASEAESVASARPGSASGLEVAAAERVPADPPGGAGAGGPAAPREPGQTRVALVIDDLGRSLEELESLHRLGVPLTYAVLPYESQTPEVVAALRRRHEEILCHLPMEPKSGGNPGPGALRAGMSRDELRQSTLAAIAAVPGAVGVNNHMGSGLSADAASMATILGVIAARGLFFLDSRTSAQSVGFRLAGSLGVPAAERQVFLDDDLHPDAIAAEFQRLLDLARTRGEAIAIGHPHPSTLATLAADVPRAQALGYHFVPVSSLLERPAPASPITGR